MLYVSSPRASILLGPPTHVFDLMGVFAIALLPAPLHARPCLVGLFSVAIANAISTNLLCFSQRSQMSTCSSIPRAPTIEWHKTVP